MISEWLNCGAIISDGKGQLLVGWGDRQWFADLPNGRSVPYFYFPDFFFKSGTPWFSHENFAVIPVDELNSMLSTVDIRQAENSIWRSPSKSSFQTTFASLQGHFVSGQLQKTVPYVFESTSNVMTPSQLRQSLQSSLNYIQNYNAYIYGFWDSSHGILGATPELLFNVNGQTLETMACAGTASATIDPNILLASAKELEEHHYVVRGITEALALFGNIDIGETEVLKLPKLSHLVTPITVQLSTSTCFELIVKALHPTPALGA